MRIPPGAGLAVGGSAVSAWGQTKGMFCTTWLPLIEQNLRHYYSPRIQALGRHKLGPWRHKASGQGLGASWENRYEWAEVEVGWVSRPRILG